ncbi:type I protein arginine methyltransferase [Entomortierella parvispora]|uniref:type I protein arginine methyltransferase n=1 Tax=Entomortierella parvispora TaxID=205924 RepID=A0A9P3H6X4_9FUNG|nr:type I protein arginine methyltransferase [Entomortierella parvispora]
MSSHAAENASNEARDPAYFGYYAMLQHQQNMLQDTVRTSTYRSAILLNTECFEDKLVMDVGAGSGILSYFAVQAGAKKVYAVEASEMATKMKKLVQAASLPDGRAKNEFLKDKVEVIQSKIEDPSVKAPMVDTIISEPIGVLLVHERMIESFIYARDKFLKPGGHLFPNKGTMFLAPFTDALLFTETMGKARFWEQDSFHGVDLTPLYPDAKTEMFGMPVVGHFDPKSLLATPTADIDGYEMDFNTITMKALRDFVVPITWKAQYTGLMHGVAGWFDLTFSGNPESEASQPIEMSTGPSAEKTHWQQVRFLFREPLAVNAGQNIRGWMHCVVNDMRSYTVDIEVIVGNYGELSDPSEPFEPLLEKQASAQSTRRGDQDEETLEDEEDDLQFLRRRGRWELHEQSYNYSYTGTNDLLTKPEHLCMYEPENVDDAYGGIAYTN